MKELIQAISVFISIAVSCIFYPNNTNAQICTGSLGDPVVNVTFGSGSNPGSSLPVGVTTYNFTASSCPDDGSYTIVNSSSGCFGSTWHNVDQDHTSGDANGYMMLINASFTPGDFYVNTVNGLCANTTYEFSAWILNIIKSSSCNSSPINPKLIFNIETTTGAVLGSYSTGEIQSSGSPKWQQFGLFFTTPAANNSVVIRITNSAPGGCGNDLILDDITFRPCGPVVKTTVGNNNESSINFCKGNVSPVTLSATIGSGYITPSFQWQESLNAGISWTDISGATNNNYTFNKSNIGDYYYRLTVAEGVNINVSSCRVASNADTISIRDLPSASANSNGPVCEKSLVQLTAAGGETYNWNGPANFTSQLADPTFVATSANTGKYSVTVTDAFGCKASADVDLVINPKPVVVISSNKNICEGDSVQLQSSGGIDYLWFPSTGISETNVQNPVAKPVASTIYNVVVTDIKNCKDTASVSITVNQKPIADAGPDKVILTGEKIALDAVDAGTTVSYIWTPADFLDNPNILNPVSSITHDTTYTLHVVSNIGCGEDTDEVFVKVYNGLFIPNAFSPNGDGRNDTWNIESLVVFPRAVLSVYNRYGEKIFETTGNSKNWDGTYKNKQVNAGSYIYMINLRNGRPTIKGTVTLIR